MDECKRIEIEGKGYGTEQVRGSELVEGGKE